MSYAALMVYVDRGPQAEARVQLACDLANAHGAALIGISAAMPELPAADPFAAGAMIGEALTLERDMAQNDIKEAEALFRRIAGLRVAEIEWRGAIDHPGSFLTREARAADLVILGRDRAPTSPAYGVDPGDVLMGAGRPVLTVPPTVERSPVGSAAVIAWKDGTEARRAVADALPLLAAASQVNVVTVADKAGQEIAARGASDVVAFLGRHKIAASAIVLSEADGPSGNQIAAFARDAQAGLIVMGGYGHARLREWTFGGVTRSMLKEGPTCLLLSH